MKNTTKFSKKYYKKLAKEATKKVMDHFGDSTGELDYKMEKLAKMWNRLTMA